MINPETKKEYSEIELLNEIRENLVHISFVVGKTEVERTINSSQINAIVGSINENKDALVAIKRLSIVLVCLLSVIFLTLLLK